MVMVSVVVILVVNQENLGLHDLADLRQPASLLYVLRGKPVSEVTLLSCRCSMHPWPGTTHIATIMNQSLPWLNYTTTRQDLRQRHPNLPLDLLNGPKNRRCSLLPTLFSIDWSNRYWQRTILDDNASFFLYSAFLDPETEGKASVRLLGVSESKAPPPAWCHLWFHADAPPLSVRVATVDYLDYQGRNGGRQMPYLLQCPLPPNASDAPLAVSLTTQPCGHASNLLRVIGGRQREVSAYRSRKVPDNPTTMVKGWAAAVCGSALFYYHEDFSARLVEWVEVMRAQGFSQVFLYVTDVHPNITKVLRHYVHEGFVEVTDYSYPPPYLNDPTLRRLWTLVERQKMFAQENVYFTDCVLRHMHQYRFIAHYDPDEVPILPEHHNFTHFLDDLIASVKGPAPPGYKLQWAYFFDNVAPSEEAAGLPAFLWMLRHTGRQASHFERQCGYGKIKAVSPKMAFLGHFKHTCDKNCDNETVHDLTLHKYKEQVAVKVQRVLSDLQLL
ncbi:hypothetical protein GWK47_032609 [Chionoecetes opilio]|uniref:Glycosyltransferase family 92 protein n=1 Tax=Chionoecetes opilio TaxID=41210 RepID=A0A8J4YIN6_CHIOP|nr:hypothetical protein GWK47_032609 [Chionoecetes opilio]